MRVVTPSRVGIVALLAALAWGIWWWNSPPLRITYSGDGVTVGVETLGEYQTTISRMRLTEQRTGNIVWEIRAGGETAQMHRVKLSPGENPAIIDAAHGEYRAVAPSGRATFTLARGTPYLIEAWGAYPSIFSSRATFELAAARDSK